MTEQQDLWTIESSEDSKQLILSSLDKTNTCIIYLYGATITSWKSNNIERLLLSKSAILDGTKAIRGGIPLVFPQFGQPLTTMLQHGFARISTWELLSHEIKSDSVTCDLSLNYTEETLKVWPHKFQLIYTITLSSCSLITKLTINNIDDKAFQC